MTVFAAPPDHEAIDSMRANLHFLDNGETLGLIDEEAGKLFEWAHAAVDLAALARGQADRIAVLESSLRATMAAVPSSAGGTVAADDEWEEDEDEGCPVGDPDCLVRRPSQIGGRHRMFWF